MKRAGLKITKLYPKTTIVENLELWLNIFFDKIKWKKKNNQKTAIEQPFANKNRVEKEIEEIFEKTRQINIDRETFEIYDNISKILLNTGYSQEQELFPFEDTILAWKKALETCGTEKEKIPKILLGIILATLYERNKKMEVSKK